MMAKKYFLIVVCMTALLWSVASDAHKPSDSYLTVTLPAQGKELHGQWDIALRDLEHAIGIDVDGDADITWGELKSRQPDLADYAFAHLAIQSKDATGNSDCPIRFQQLLADQHVDGGYAVLRFSADCAVRPAELVLNYSLLFDIDPDHRGLLNVGAEGAYQSTVLSVSQPDVTVILKEAQPWQQFRSFVKEGVWHILHGYDHILFLLTLLLPAVVIYRHGRWEPRHSMRESVIDVAKVVTAFTVVGSSRVDLQACKLEYSIVSPK